MQRGKRLFEKDLYKMDGQKVLVHDEKCTRRDDVLTVILSHVISDYRNPIAALVDNSGCHYRIEDITSNNEFCEVYELIETDKINIKKLNENAVIPKYAKDGDAGMDLFTLEDTSIKANETKIVPTGIAIQLKDGLEAQIRPRSGISLNGCKGCKTLMTPPFVLEVSPYLRVQLGTIDSVYRGEVGIITYNQENYNVLIPKGTRLAQMVIAPVSRVEFTEVNKLEDTVRGENGFGSTGLK